MNAFPKMQSYSFNNSSNTAIYVQHTEYLTEESQYIKGL